MEYNPKKKQYKDSIEYRNVDVDMLDIKVTEIETDGIFYMCNIGMLVLTYKK